MSKKIQVKKILINPDILNKYLFEVETIDKFFCLTYRSVCYKLFVALKERGGLEYVEEDTDLQKD